MISVANNVLAMNAQRVYKVNTDNRRKSTEKLSSGYKINKAADDAAGLTISEKMRSQIRGLNQGSNNIQDGISLVQIADGALAEVNDMLHRMTELSVKSANGTNTDADRRAIQKEISQIIAEINRIGESAEFNTMPLFKENADPLSGTSGNLTKLVDCGAYSATGGLSEPYLASDGKYYPSATLDFSKIDADNIGLLKDKEFSFTCGWGCSEKFTFRFVDGGRDRALGLSSQKHTYLIDIGSVTDGSTITQKIEDLVRTQPPGYSPNGVATGPEGVPASHSNMIVSKGDKLVIYSATNTIQNHTDGATSASGIRKYPTSSGAGSIDCSSMEGVFYPEPVKGFNIQCSGVLNDNIYIKSRYMNAEILGIHKMDVSTEGSARSAIDKIERAGSIVSEMRSDFGAYQNRLEHSYANNNNKAENTQAAESRIRDTDMASEMVKNTKENILIQAGEAMMAQANQSNQGVLSIIGA